MSRPSEEKFDLLVVVADLDQEEAMKGLLPRFQSLRTSQFNFKVTRLKNTPGDSGTRTNGAEYLRTMQHTFARAFLLLDRHGAGSNDTAEQFENELEERLERYGLGDRTRCVVIDPETEAWICGGSAVLEEIIGWSSPPSLKDWLVQNNWMSVGQVKPNQPKEAFRDALRRVKQSPFAPLFRKIAKRMSFQSCEDLAFKRLLNTLRTWFPANAPEDHK